MALSAPAWSSAPARADLGADVAISGGTLLPWSATGEAGNLYGAVAGVHLGRTWRFGLGLAGVLPDSRADAAFTTWVVEASWAFWLDLAGVPGLDPYAVVGVGLATEDDLEEPVSGEAAPPRWVASGPEALAMLGLGLRYGPEIGLFLALDARAYNTSHGGLTLSAGYRF